MSRHPRLTVLVLSSADDPWARIEEEGQCATWVPEAADSGIPVLRYRGTVGRWDRRASDLTKRLRDVAGPRAAGFIATAVATTLRRQHAPDAASVLRVATPEAKVLLAPKLHLALRWLLRNSDFEVLFRTNSSTYVNVDALRRESAELPTTDRYAGVVGLEEFGAITLPYAAGMGIHLSRDVVERVVRSRLLLSTVVDDVALGLACRTLGYTVTPARRGDAHSLAQAQALPEHELHEVAFIRCKSELERGQRADEEIAIMRHLHARLHGNAAGIP